MTRSPLPSGSCSLACRALSTVPEMPPEMWIETTSSPWSTSGSYTSMKSPIEGWDVVGSRSVVLSRS